MELMTHPPLYGDRQKKKLMAWLEYKIWRAEQRSKAAESLRAGDKEIRFGKVQQTSDTSATPVTAVTSARHHSWSQIMLVPVTVVPDPRDGEPLLFLDEDEFNLAREDPRIGCLHCNMSLHEGWDRPCEGAA